MPSVTFLLALEVPDVMPDALLAEAEDILDDLTRSGHDVLSVVPWARPSNPVAQPSGGFSSLSPLGGTPPPAAPTA